MVKTRDILALINTIAPFDIAEEWDNSGLQVGNRDWEVNRVMIGLDVSLPLMMAAKQGNCDLVLTHHPLMIRPEKSIDFNQMPGSAIELAARHRISIVSAHTNLDKASDGLNDYFASRMGLKNTIALSMDPPSPLPTDEITGIGRIGYLASPIPLEQLVRQTKETLGLRHVRVTGDMALPVTTVAICTGSGGSLMDVFLRSFAAVYITGDIKYHEARRVEESGKALIDVGHFASEHMAVDLLADKLGQAIQTAGLNIQIIPFKKEKDPFTIV
ncbi:Nif3-like dinuclear metal center hexameric protein [Desulfobacula sp.]|uniref:Nif3-like dinuclear metal center hexameric protein n=1 Tax=Desulfobacula sp. TaxID=2593537 RepID=UPI00260E7BE6|nr:Nif3-like dinuclear metal center hexameric protein [Desulfobacula sp.]